MLNWFPPMATILGLPTIFLIVGEISSKTPKCHHMVSIKNLENLNIDPKINSTKNKVNMLQPYSYHRFVNILGCMAKFVTKKINCVHILGWAHFL